MSAFLWF